MSWPGRRDHQPPGAGGEPRLTGLAYLFERFPSFTQTFCAREVAALRTRGFGGPVYSVRDPSREPVAQEFPAVGEVVNLPASFEEILSSDARFRRDARKWQEALRDLWGDESQKRRIYEALWLRRECAQRNSRHLHGHFAGLAARTAFWLERMGGPGFSFTAHANDIFRDEPPERLAQILAASRAVVAVSEFGAAFLRERFPEAAPKIHRIYNGIDPGRFPRSEFPPGPPLLVAVGRSIEKKGFPDLVEACARLTDIPFRCEIIGGGPMDECLRERIASLELEGRVEILGPRNEPFIAGRLRAARAFVLPCVHAADGALDNLPTVIMEAMAAGLPVVSTPLAGIPEMVMDAQTGFLVPERDPAALAAALRGLLTDPARARQLGEAGHALCLERFAIDKTSCQLEELFAKILSSG